MEKYENKSVYNKIFKIRTLFCDPLWDFFVIAILK